MKIRGDKFFTYENISSKKLVCILRDQNNAKRMIRTGFCQYYSIVHRSEHYQTYYGRKSLLLEKIEKSKSRIGVSGKQSNGSTSLNRISAQIEFPSNQNESGKWGLSDKPMSDWLGLAFLTAPNLDLEPLRSRTLENQQP